MKTSLLLSALLVLFALGCSSLKKIVEPPKVDVTDVRLAQLKGDEATLEIVLEVYNPNGISVTVDKLQYDLQVNEKSVTSGVFDKDVKLAAKQNTVVAIPISVNYKDLLKTALNVFLSKGAPYRAKGNVGVGPLNIPFDEKGMIKMKDL